MNLKMAENPLQLHTGADCKTHREPVTYAAEEYGISEILKTYLIHDANVVLWEMNRIIWGTWQDGVLKLSDDSQTDKESLLEMRAFNEMEEIHLTRDGDTFWGRCLRDGEGAASEYVDSLSRFWGEKNGREDDFVLLEDKERKLHMTVPCVEEAEWYGLITRNYIGYAENGQAGYVDCRYVKVVGMEVK